MTKLIENITLETINWVEQECYNWFNVVCEEGQAMCDNFDETECYKLLNQIKKLIT